VVRTGQCWDNALAESFFASLKRECLDQQSRPKRARARRAIVEYIAWFNGTRLHSALGSLTPDEYERATGEEGIEQEPDRAINPVRQSEVTPLRQ
jgi:putative transposase